MTLVLKPKKEITVPPSVRRKAGLKAGDRVAFKVSGRTITIVPERGTKADRALVKRERAVDPDDALTKDEAKQVRHGMKQIREGRFRLLRDVTNELAR